METFDKQEQIMGVVKLDNEVTLMHGNCLEVLRDMPDKCVDAIFADLPYGNETAYLSYVDTKENLRDLISEFMPEALRVAKSIFITCGVANMWLYPEPTWTLAWVNPAGVGSSCWGFTCWQPILAYGKDPYLQDGKGRRPDTFFQKKTEKDKNAHPCPKPDNVMRWIIERTTRVGDMVLDPFMGSGATGVACVRLGRKFIGIELDRTYVDIAIRRTREEQRQPQLWRADSD